MLISPDQQLNVEADHRATAALDALRAAKQTTEFYPLPACRAYLRDATGHIQSRNTHAQNRTS
jgi:hypothetical protein